MLEPKVSTTHNMLSRVRRNVAILLGGNGIASLLGFAALAFNARALGPDQLGVLALLQAFVVVVTSVFSFDTWQPVIKFGAEAQAANDSERLRDIVMLGFVYDLAGALAATVIGFAIVVFSLPLIGIEPQYQTFAGIYCITILFSSYSSAKGVLRLFGRFELLTAVQVGTSATSLAAAVSLWFFQAPFTAYVVTYAGLIAAQSCAIILVAIALWRSNQLPTLIAPRFNDHLLRKAFMRFSWSTSGLSTLNVVRQSADAFVLAALLGPAATGIYKIAPQIASLVSRFGDPLQQVMFPEIAGLIAQGEHLRLRRILASVFLAGMALLVVVVTGAAVGSDMAVQVVGGAAYTAAAVPLLWLACAHGLTVSGFYLRPTVVTLIGPAAYLGYNLVATVVFIPALYFGIILFGIAGAGFAQAAFTVVWFVLNAGALTKQLKITPSDFSDAFRHLAKQVRT